MNYSEYKKQKKLLEDQLSDLEEAYLNEHGIPVGTPVLYLGDDWIDSTGSLKNALAYVTKVSINFVGEVTMDIRKATKTGKPSNTTYSKLWVSKSMLKIANHVTAKTYVSK